MNDTMTGKVALVTGGLNGIGKACVEQFIARGANVVVADIATNGGELCAVWNQRGQIVEFVQADVRNASDMANAVSVAEEHFGGLDILVNNAGIFPRATLEETTDELWDTIMDINLKGVFYACRAALPALKHRGSGVIINIGSLNTFGGTPDLFAYSASKGGVASLTLNLARALAQYKIRVNCVHPGWVLTEGERKIQREGGRPDNWVEIEGPKLPLGRLQTPEDIASSVVFLASDDANQITGQFLTVDGGHGFHY